MITFNLLLSVLILAFLVWRLGPLPKPEPVQTPDIPETYQPLTCLLFNRLGNQVAERVIHDKDAPTEMKHGGIVYERSSRDVRGIIYTRKL